MTAITNKGQVLAEEQADTNSNAIELATELTVA